MKNYKLRAKNIEERDRYVQFMTNLNQDGARRVVYMDESYLHKNYQRHDDFLFDLDDEQNLEVKAMHKGQSYCSVAAIIVENKFMQNVPDEKRPFISKAHLMLETYDVFKSAKKTNRCLQQHVRLKQLRAVYAEAIGYAIGYERSEFCDYDEYRQISQESSQGNV